MARVVARYQPSKVGFAACARGPELRAAVVDIASHAMAFAVAISPEEPREYVGSFDIDVEVVPDIPYRRRGLPMARVSAILVNKSSKAVLIEVGGGDIPDYRVLGRTLEWIEMAARI